MQLPFVGGRPIALASDQDHPCRLAVEGGSVYWRNQYDDLVMTVAVMMPLAVVTMTAVAVTVAVVAMIPMGSLLTVMK